MAQDENLGDRRGLASKQQPESTDKPDHHQVQHANHHTDDRRHEVRSPSGEPGVVTDQHGSRGEGCSVSSAVQIPGGPTFAGRATLPDGSDFAPGFRPKPR
jgi:hypothetical protein